MSVKQRGFNLVELMIALVIGLVLMMSITTMFVDTKVSSNRSATVSNLQQQAQLALQILVEDVRNIGSWAEFTGESLKDINVPKNMAIGGCAIGPASDAETTSFPETANWISRAGRSENCVSEDEGYHFSATSDALLITRIQGRVVSSAPLAANGALVLTDYYVASSPETAKLFIGADANDVTNMTNANVYPYIRHAYFVESKDNAAPRLMRFSLQGDQMDNDLVVENIERIRIEFGIDDPNQQGVSDGIADRYEGSDNIAPVMWNSNRIVAARIYVLARATNMDASFNNTWTYQLDSDGVDNNDYTPGDNYRRFLLSTTVVIKNNVMGVIL